MLCYLNYFELFELIWVFMSCLRFKIGYLIEEWIWKRCMLIYDRSKAIRKAKSSKKWESQGAAARSWEAWFSFSNRFFLCIRHKKVQTRLGKETSDILYTLLWEQFRWSAKSCTWQIKLRDERCRWDPNRFGFVII